LTPGLQTAIVNAITAGVPIARAAVLAGITQGAVLEWIQRGEGRHATRPAIPPYVEFAEAIARAQAADEARRIARIEQAGRGGAVVWRKVTRHKDGAEVVEERVAPPDWQADAWHLERRYPEEYGRQPVRKVAFTTPDGEEAWEPQVVLLPSKAPTPEQWAQDAQAFRVVPPAGGAEA
jgi:hypothetical protein